MLARPLNVRLLHQAKAPAGETRAPLSDPRFGLAWSNQGAGEDILLRNALIQGRFTAILESAARDGLPFVRAELARLQGAGAINERAGRKAESMLASIERGFAGEVASAPASKGRGKSKP
jgi:hypothetical protein